MTVEAKLAGEIRQLITLVEQLQAENRQLAARLRIVDLMEQEAANRWGLAHAVTTLHEVTH